MITSVWARIQSAFGGPSGHWHSRRMSRAPFQVPLFPFSLLFQFLVLRVSTCPLSQRDLFANPYASPQIILISDLLRFLSSQPISCTLVVPDVCPRKFWWPLLRQHDSFILAVKGSKGIVLPPTTSGFSFTWPFPWDLWVFRFTTV